MPSKLNRKKENRRLLGKGLSPGIVIAKALVLESRQQLIFKKEVAESATAREIDRLKRALEQSKNQLLGMKERITRKLGKEHGYILDAHILMLEDKTLIEEVVNLIKTERVNVEWAIKERTDKLIKEYAALKDEYFRERGSDIEDVTNRILLNLMGSKKPKGLWPEHNAVIVAKELNASMIAALNYRKVKGFAIESMGHTSHAAILARSLGIPAVMHLENITSHIGSGETVIVDGEAGLVIASPTKQELAYYKGQRPAPAPAERNHSCQTRDAHKVTIEVNIEMLDQVESAMHAGAEGIGLFRSEFLLFRSRDGYPSEEEQFKAYRLLAEGAFPYTATIRTFDLGADKLANVYNIAREVNPALGLRGIRLSLQSLETFQTQIKAILRASAYGHLKIVLPLVSRIEEVLEAKKIIATAKMELRKDLAEFDQEIPLGVMIEVPSAVLLADALCREVDFFCIGTNDLIQYTLAVDRVDENVCHLFEPFHPSVLRSIALLVKTAKRHNIPVKACGEATANPIYAMVLLGMGIDAFSLNVNSIPIIKHFLKTIDFKTASALARKVCSFSSASQVEKYISKKIHWPFNSTS